MRLAATWGLSGEREAGLRDARERRELDGSADGYGYHDDDDDVEYTA